MADECVKDVHYTSSVRPHVFNDQLLVHTHGFIFVASYDIMLWWMVPGVPLNDIIQSWVEIAMADEFVITHLRWFLSKDIEKMF